jgi:hypothetical protein
MPHSIPTGLTTWRAEIAAAYAAARAILAASEDSSEDEFWHHMEDQAIAQALTARGRPGLSGTPEEIDRMVDVITDITERLRKHGDGDPDDHHVSEQQFFLLYYLGAQVHAGLLTEAVAGEIVRGCWAEASDADDDAHTDADGAEDEDEPWPITRPAPVDSAGWLEEVLSAWEASSSPPPLRSAEGKPVIASGTDLRESGVILALYRRGCKPPAEGVYGLIGVITEMEEDIAGLGPELARLKKTPAMAFVLYYVWTHILIGHADEATAMAVVQEAANNLAEFIGGEAPRKGSSRFRRKN